MAYSVGNGFEAGSSVGATGVEVFQLLVGFKVDLEFQVACVGPA